MGERNDIAAIIGALAVNVDARRWNELVALFAPEVRVDYVSLFGGEAQSMKREELIAGWRKLLPGFTRTCHIIGAPVISLSGDTAQASASVVAWHFVKTPELAGRDCWLVGGLLRDELQEGRRGLAHSQLDACAGLGRGKP
jgi:hypothetical protein